MKKSYLFIAIALSTLFLYSTSSFEQKELERNVGESNMGIANPANKGFAVVELFTSEGCSSCPSAEALMKDLSDKYKNQFVYFVEYHVDYWNKLGWKDQFSKAAFTDHQYYYGSLFNLRSIYTPQAVINGSYEYVGSSEEKVTAAINNQIKSLTVENRMIHVTANEHQILATLKNENLNIDEVVVLVLVGDKATVSIGRGENSGLKLEHYNIALERKEFAQTDNISLEYNKSIFNGNMSVIYYIQNKKTGKIASANIYRI